ncbi:chloride channel protein, partial [Sphingomonas bacterium]|uniref:chloride channel protein n=1 Tax=Sphingomonas bacterium TaxID=1895847 RepID=UPI001575EA73
VNLRRAEVRTLVGAGAGAAIAGTFGAPLAGAFYAFEIVIGAYTPASIAPIVAAALTGTLVAQLFGQQPYLIQETANVAVETHHYLIYAGLAVICALVGIVIMRAVALVEAGTRWARFPGWARPAIGGLCLIPIAMLSPQALSAGHGALHADLMLGTSLGFIALVLLAKSLASIVSLGFGFRGGLFFASLFLGTLIGHLFAGLLQLAFGHPVVDPYHAAMVGMAALAVAVIGGPFTMAMLVLEATQNFSLTGAVLAASLVASTIVRELFGYSFSTWRLHLRGETIKSARDIGWTRALTAGGMMRREAHPTHASTSVAAFRQRFALGATSRVVLVDGDGHYAGIVQTAAAYVEGTSSDAAIGTLAISKDAALTPDMTILTVMKRFDASGADELAVLDDGRRVLGLLSEAYVRRRYGEELDKSQKELFGE